MFEVNSHSEYRDEIRRLFQAQFPVSSVKADGSLPVGRNRSSVAKAGGLQRSPFGLTMEMEGL